MTIEPRRRFTMADAMIFVAATAVGFGLIRSTNMDSLPPTGHRLRYVSMILQVNQAVVPFLFAWTPALLILRLIPPRPVMRRLARQPGMVACSSATLAIAIALITPLILGATIGVENAHRRGFLIRTNQMVDHYGRYVPFSIEGAWVTLALCGLWRPERHWIDRLGTILGVTWITRQVFEKCIHVFVALAS